MVRVTTPRIAPLDPDALGPEAQKVMGNFKGETPLNIFRTLAQHPDLLRRWLVFANHVLGKSSLAPRPRELVSFALAGCAVQPMSGGSTWRSDATAALRTPTFRRLRPGPKLDIGVRKSNGFSVPWMSFT